MRAAKSRSKTEDPEQAKLKAKVNANSLKHWIEFKLFESCDCFPPLCAGERNAARRNGRTAAARCQFDGSTSYRAKEETQIGHRRIRNVDSKYLSTFILFFRLDSHANAFLSGTDWRQHDWTGRRSSDSTATAHQTRQFARHGLLHGAGARHLQKFHAVQVLPQVIDSVDVYQALARYDIAAFGRSISGQAQSSFISNDESLSSI